jgi:hypothetical protein
VLQVLRLELISSADAPRILGLWSFQVAQFEPEVIFLAVGWYLRRMSTWRGTGITIYLDGRLEHAQQMAGHESPRTTMPDDRTKDEITVSEVERNPAFALFRPFIIQTPLSRQGGYAHILKGYFYTNLGGTLKARRRL